MVVGLEIVLMISLHGTLVRDQTVEERSYQRPNTKKKMNSSHPNHHDHDDVDVVTHVQIPIHPETAYSQYHACRYVIMKQEKSYST